MFVNNHSHRLTQTATTNPFMLDEFVVMGAHGECEAFAASKNIEAKRRRMFMSLPLLYM